MDDIADRNDPDWLPLHCDELTKHLAEAKANADYWLDEYNKMVAVVETLEAANAALVRAAERVCWYDWSSNDSDAVADITVLRVVVGKIKEGGK